MTEFEHPFGLAVPDLEHHVCASHEQRRRPRKDAPEECIPVSATLESSRWVPLPDLRGELPLGGDVVHVRRVRYEKIDGSVQEL